MLGQRKYRRTRFSSGKEINKRFMILRGDDLTFETVPSKNRLNKYRHSDRGPLFLCKPLVIGLLTYSFTGFLVHNLG